MLALRVLCIPATSAPLERFFSVAGLTITKDRARLAPQRANELIFLHDAIPALKGLKNCDLVFTNLLYTICKFLLVAGAFTAAT